MLPGMAPPPRKSENLFFGRSSVGTAGYQISVCSRRGSDGSPGSRRRGSVISIVVTPTGYGPGGSPVIFEIDGGALFDVMLRVVRMVLRALGVDLGRGENANARLV